LSQLDDDGFAAALVPGVVAPEWERDAHHAAATCPERAIQVER
jgi:ferredoxin